MADAIIRKTKIKKGEVGLCSAFSGCLSGSKETSKGALGVVAKSRNGVEKQTRRRYSDGFERDVTVLGGPNGYDEFCKIVYHNDDGGLEWWCRLPQVVVLAVNQN